MTDVASVYAELGFKVDKTGIKEFRKSLMEAKAGVEALAQVEKLRAVQEKTESARRLHFIKEEQAQSVKVSKDRLLSLKKTDAFAKSEAARKSETLKAEKLQASIDSLKLKDKIALDREADRKEDRESKKKKEQERRDEKARKEAEKAQRKREASLKASLGFMSRLVGLSSLFSLGTLSAFGKMSEITGKKGLGLKQFGFVSGGTDVKKLQGYQAAAYKYAPTMKAEDVTSQILGLQQRALDAYMGGNAKAFQILGINALERDPFKIIDQLRKAARTTDKQNIPILTKLLGEMGMSPEWLNILNAPEKDFSVLTTGMMTEDQIKRSAEMGQQFRVLGFELGNLKDQFVLAFGDETQSLLSRVNELVKYLSKDVKGVSEDIKKNFKDIWAGITLPFDAIHDLGKTWGNFIGGVFNSYDAEKFINESFPDESKKRLQYFKDNPEEFKKLIGGVSTPNQDVSKSYIDNSMRKELTTNNSTTNQTINVSYAPHTSFTNPTEQQVREVSRNVGNPNVETIAEAFRVNAAYQALKTV